MIALCFIDTTMKYILAAQRNARKKQAIFLFEKSGGARRRQINITGKIIYEDTIFT